MSMTTQEIMEILPHRHPFLLIDTVEEVEPGVRAVAKKNVTFNEPFFAGHFPQEPVMPGVLTIEALAQTGAVAILSLPENKGKTARNLCRKWACQGRFDAAKMLCDTAKNGPESAVEMLKIYERIRAENCEKIGEKPLNFMKSSENYVQIAQKTM